MARSEAFWNLMNETFNPQEILVGTRGNISIANGNTLRSTTSNYCSDVLILAWLLPLGLPLPSFPGIGEVGKVPCFFGLLNTAMTNI